MTPPYEQPGTDVVFWLLVAFFVLGQFVLRVRSGAGRSGRRSEGWSLAVVVVLLVGGIVAGFVLARWHGGSIGTAQWPLFALGLALMAAGFGLRQWAIVTLGSLFTGDVRVHPGQTVVERGPYRLVRHPSYTGFLVFLVGLGLALGNWASLLVLVLLPAAGLLVRIRREERALSTALGEDYRRYAAAHRRLFPGVW